MAAVGLLEAEIVAADGAVRIANACTNPDLYWGIKGGGGGSLGVLTRLTLRTRELPAWFGAAFLTVKAASAAAFRQLIGKFVNFYSESLFNPHWGESVDGREIEFSVRATEGAKEIGAGSHSRIGIDAAKFVRRLE
jgi:FAD/FMN-containing dehydrogenase